MRNYNILLITLCFILASCGEDRRKEYAFRTEPNEWIEQKMRDVYYWYKEMPSSKDLNYFSDASYFFESLLVKTDASKHFSYFEKLDQPNTRGLYSPSYSYGFDYTTQQSKNNKNNYFVRILYVVENSPASEAGLKRGDWIIKINDIDITKNNSDLLRGDDACKLTLGKRNTDEEIEGEIKDEFIEIGSVEIKQARPVTENPILYADVYEVGTKKVGYLVYNQFVSGLTEGDYTYDNKLSELSLWFKSEGVSEFILDLRYNTGGTIPPAQLLCTMLVPQENIGKEMCYIEYNDKHTDQNTAVMFTQESLRGGTNLNLTTETIYIITGSNTASSSELMINALKPYFKGIVTIGATTIGKNVGSQAYRDPESKYPWIIHPIVCKIYNSERESNYESGFAPSDKFRFNELDTKYADQFLPFGDKNELLLDIALRTIEGTYPEPEEEEEQKVRGMENSPVWTSLDRKALPGVILQNKTISY